MRGFISDFVEENNFRNELIKNLPEESKSKARDLYESFDKISWQTRQSILHGFFISMLPPLLLAGLFRGENASFLCSLVQGLLLYVLFFCIFKKTLSHFYFEEKVKKLIGNLASELEKDDEFREIFWLIRNGSEGRFEFEIANRVWREMVRREKQQI